MRLPPAVLADMTAHHGLTTRRRLRAAGVAVDAVDGLVRRGVLVTVQRGVYRLAGSAVPPEQALLAAVWRAGEGARLAGEQALWLHGLHETRPGGRASVLIPPSRQVTAVGFHVCRTPVPPAHRVTVRHVPTLRVERAIVEVARTASPRRIRTLVDSARWLGALRVDRLVRCARELPGHAGARAVLAAQAEGTFDPESEGERLLRQVLGPLAATFRWGATDVVPGVRLDAYDDLADLALEFDGARHHTDDGDITTDRTRELRVRAGGTEVVRITWAMLRDDPERTRRRIAAVRDHRLAARGAPGR